MHRELVLLAGILIIQSAAGSEFPASKYLRTWNETITFEQALSQSLPFTSERFQKWTNRLKKDHRPHRISFEFLSGNRFFMRAPKRLTLYDFSQIQENILIVSRKNFQIDLHESYENLAQKLELQGRGPTKSFFSLLIPFIQLFDFGAFSDQAYASSLSSLDEDWCALVSVLDIFTLAQKKTEQRQTVKPPTSRGRD